MKESLLLPCRNSQKTKVKMCCFSYLKKRIVTVTIILLYNFNWAVDIWERQNRESPDFRSPEVGIAVVT